jgi:hypothetical protein
MRAICSAAYDLFDAVVGGTISFLFTIYIICKIYSVMSFGLFALVMLTLG